MLSKCKQSNKHISNQASKINSINYIFYQSNYCINSEIKYYNLDGDNFWMLVYHGDK